MRSEYINKMNANMPKLKRCIILTTSVNHMKEYKVFRSDEVDEITDNKMANEQKIQILIKKIARKDDEDYVTFITMLRRTGQTEAFVLLSEGIEIQYEYDELKAMFDQACTLIENLQIEITKLKTQIEVARNNNVNYLKKLQRMDKERDDVADKMKGIKEKIDEKDRTITRLTIELEELKADQRERTDLIEDDDDTTKPGPSNNSDEGSLQDVREIAALRTQLQAMMDKMGELIKEISQTKRDMDERSSENESRLETVFTDRVDDLKQALSGCTTELKGEILNQNKQTQNELQQVKSQMAEFMSMYKNDKEEAAKATATFAVKQDAGRHVTGRRDQPRVQNVDRENSCVNSGSAFSVNDNGKTGIQAFSPFTHAPQERRNSSMHPSRPHGKSVTNQSLFRTRRK